MGEHKSKKRKRDVVIHQAPKDNSNGIDTSKPTAVFQSSGKGRSSTLSLAVPGSIIANCQSHDLRNALAGRIARAAAVFCVDEIIVFNDGQSQAQPARAGGRVRDFDSEEGYTGVSDPDNFLFHVLSYLECPPYLRTRLFELHPNLRTAGSSHSLDMPHHLKADEWCRYREGVTVESSSKPGTSEVYAGFEKPIVLEAPIPPYTRVTLKFNSSEAPPSFPPGPNASPPPAEAVDPAEPREEAGYYWGYTVRQASSLSTVFTECPHEEGYDVSIGTSERGVPLSDVLYKRNSTGGESARWLTDSFKHALIVIGGVAGLEAAAAADVDLVEKGITKSNVGDLFDFWVNACPGQGSRTIRAEEAVWVVLSQLHSWNQAASKS